MAASALRSRAGTITYTESEVAELGSHLERLKGITATPSGLLEDTQARTESLNSIRHSITANAQPNHVKDAFRHLHGFQMLLELVRDTGQKIADGKCSKKELDALLELYDAIFSLLTAALEDHWGNRRYFRTRVEGGGWASLQALLEPVLQNVEKYQDNVGLVTERLFGSLVAFALADWGLNQLFSTLGNHIDSQGDGLLKQPKFSTSESNNDEILGNTADSGGSIAAQHLIRGILGPRAFLCNPEIIPVMIGLWLVLKKKQHDSQNDSFSQGTLLLPHILNCIIDASTHNVVAVHKTGILTILLPVFLDSSVTSPHMAELQRFAVALLQLGVTNLNDAHFLYRNASSSRAVAELLRLTFKETPTPAYIHFDLSLHGFSSIELPDLGRTFPPMGPSAGYTLSLWIQVLHFDAGSHTTIFGAFDSSQTCFVLVYLEKDTRNLILQTSVTSSRPSVRFKSFKFDESRWYHVCLVHRRPKPTSSSRASLFIDGEFVEQVKANYPAPPQAISSPDRQNLRTSARKEQPVQAFVGTPQDLASKLGRGLDLSEWRMASALLFDDVLSDDLIAVHKQLGPRYHGNYQDCLGSFQTYQASAALNLRNENLHPGKEEKSDIVSAIRSKASGLLPETKILLNLSAMAVINGDDSTNVDDGHLIRSLSKSAAKSLRNNTRGGRTVIINGAIPSVNEALLHSYGFAVLTGDPVVVIPQALDDAAWRVGGCAPIGLSLLDAAKTSEDIVRALDILLGSFRDNWRNSEAMERENGFGVLATLLTAKLENFPTLIDKQNGQDILHEEHGQEELALKALMRILEFVGYQVKNPEDSIINNPLAYRTLLVDLDVWRTSFPKVQKLYYEQFITFATGSKHRNFNVKRLARMRKLRAHQDNIKIC